MRYRLTLWLVTLMMVSATAGLAQNGLQQRAGNQAGIQVPVNAEPVVLTGTVISANLVAGQGLPSISFRSNLGDVTVLVSPYRLFLDSEFEIYQGQALEIRAFADPRVPTIYVASEIRDVASQATLVLRNAAGQPNAGRGGYGFMGGRGAAGSFRGGGAGAGRGRMGGTGDCAYVLAGLNAQEKVQLVGTVESVDMQATQGTPSFLLAVGERRVPVIACPYRTLLQAGFQIFAGDQLSVEAYPLTNVDGTYLAALIQNITRGTSLKLRDEKGMPLGTQGPGMMRGIRRRR